MELYKNSLMKPDTHFYYFGYSTDINCYLIVTIIAITIFIKSSISCYLVLNVLRK